jgi:exonuclease III
MDNANKDTQNIELLSLNTNGLRDERKRRSLFHWLKKYHKAEEKIILLQETHTNTENEALFKNDWGHRNIIFSHGDNLSKGVAIILPNSEDYIVNSKQCDPNGRYIAINITIKTETFWVINCYAPTANDPNGQIIWLTKIQSILEETNGTNIIIGGDLNDYFIPYLDKYKVKENTAETDYVRAWKATCNDLDLLDIWKTLNPDCKRYTWRQGKTIETLKQSRLDYWLISTHMIYELTDVDIMPGFRSDHSLIELNFKNQNSSDRGPSYWRFNAKLLTNIDYTSYMNNRIDEIIEKCKDIENAGLKWDIIKMEIRSSTVCFSKKTGKRK